VEKGRGPRSYGPIGPFVGLRAQRMTRSRVIALLSLHRNHLEHRRAMALAIVALIITNHGAGDGVFQVVLGSLAFLACSFVGFMFFVAFGGP